MTTSASPYGSESWCKDTHDEYVVEEELFDPGFRDAVGRHTRCRDCSWSCVAWRALLPLPSAESRMEDYLTPTDYGCFLIRPRALAAFLPDGQTFLRDIPAHAAITTNDGGEWIVWDVRPSRSTDACIISRSGDVYAAYEYGKWEERRRARLEAALAAAERA